MRVGAIGPKLDGHGTEDAELAGHLVHPAQGPLLIGVGKLDHQTRRGTLRVQAGLQGGCSCTGLEKRFTAYINEIKLIQSGVFSF